LQINQTHNEDSVLPDFSPFLIGTDKFNIEVIENDEEDTFNKYNNTFDQENDDFIEGISDIYHFGEEITEEALAAAYLSAFYNGRTTQSSLADYLKLSNLTSQIKLPTTFNGLRNLVMGNHEQLTYSKSWYCSNCMKIYDKLSNSHQRLCTVCNTRYEFVSIII